MMALVERQRVPIRNNAQIKPIIIAVVFTALATTAVILRLIAKKINRSSLTIDDFMIMLALFFIYALMTCDILGVVSGGVGLHAKDIADPRSLTLFLKGLIGVQLAWGFSLMFIKFSLLFFYIRIFSIRSFRLTAYVVMFFVGCWALNVVLNTFLLCRPFNYNWNPTVKATCGNRNASYIASGGLNIFTDIMVLSLPVPMVWSLQIPRRNKIMLSIVFGMGLFVCIVSILRLVSLLAITYEDITYSVPDPYFWSMIEPCVGCVCACIPLMRPIFSAVFPDRSKGYKNYGYIPEHQRGLKDIPNNDSQQSGEYEGAYSLTVTGKQAVSNNEVQIYGGKGKESFSGEPEEGMQGSPKKKGSPEGINVKKEIRVQHD